MIITRSRKILMWQRAVLIKKLREEGVRQGTIAKYLQVHPSVLTIFESYYDKYDAEVGNNES